MADPDLDDIERRMSSAIEALKKELTGLRTGRASPQLLETVTVEAYGATMPLNQVGSISVLEARTLGVQVWDKGLVSAVDKAIRESGLGLNPATSGQLVRIPIPALSTERRQELSKVAGRYCEQAKVAVRNVRRDGMEMLKKMEKDGDLSEDEQRLWADEVQGLTDTHVKQADELLAAKEEEIMQV
ncbi:MAG: ribosome recycling factor [Pseudomonadota bacterium]